ncbi:unnamed protein product [Effrenium voratum]|nr:unnamed protein product [Effrenium voratum]
MEAICALEGSTGAGAGTGRGSADESWAVGRHAGRGGEKLWAPTGHAYSASHSLRCVEGGTSRWRELPGAFGVFSGCGTCTGGDAAALVAKNQSSTAPASGAGATGAAAGAAATSPASQSAAQALAMNSMGMMMPGMMMPGFSGYDMLSAMGMAGMGMGMAMPGMGMMGMPTMPGMMPGMLPQQPESGSAKAAPKAAA